MPLVDRAQIGFKKETTVGTPVTVDRFAEFVTEKVQPMQGRVRSNGLRSGHRVRRTDRQVPYKMGAAGSISVELLSKGFGFWLEHMLGTVATTGPSDSAYTHTGTIGTMTGLGFTFQSNHPFHPGNTNQALTYTGGKIPKWTISNKVGEFLIADLDVDFIDYTTATALASASYPTAGEPLSFVGGVVSVGGSAVDVYDATVSCDNKLMGDSSGNDRRYLRGSALHKELVEANFREVAWDLTADFESLTQFNRFSTSTAAGALATITLTWTGAILIGSASYPTLTVTIQNASFDGFNSTIDGPAPLRQKLSGVGLYDGSTSAVSVAYTTADSTP